MATLKEQADRIRQALQRQRTMVKLRREGNTLQQIGDVYGMTRERVRQILKAAEQDRGSS
jgi:DNA-directed RNA polymerase sigma subunit (sigma70/sigma32)